MKMDVGSSQRRLVQQQTSRAVPAVSAHAGGGLQNPSRIAIASALMFAALPLTAAAADPLDNLRFSLAGGAPNLDLRVRAESVDQDNMANEGDALTLRARVGYTTGKWNDIDAQLEYEGLTSIGDDDYNSSENGRSEFPVVADPDFNELNQAWIRYSGLPGTTLKYGRQRILLDNQRFVGNVGWRQNETTFDAALLSTTVIPRTAFTYAHLSNVNSFRFFDFNPDPAAVSLDNDVDVNGHVINATVSVIDKKLNLTGYGYLFDFDDIPAAPVARLFQDTQTLGLRATGAIPVKTLTLSYALEYADQQDCADAPTTVDAEYSLAEVALGYGKIKGTLGYETLGGDGVYSFQTPLATAHMHQGWADQFVITPLGGLQRTYLGLSASVQKLGLTAVYHDFQSDKGSADYGSEVDLLASYALIENFTISAKYAAYSADEFPTAGTPARTFDTAKSWLFAEYKF